MIADYEIDRAITLGPPPVEYRLIYGKPAYRIGSDGIPWSRAGIGRSRRLKDEWHPMTLHHSKKGYVYIKIPSDKKVNGKTVSSTRYVHRLVLEMFVGLRPEGMVCRHLDGNPENNRLENLVWGTPQENSDDMKRHGRKAGVRGERHPRAKINDGIARQIFDLDAQGLWASEIGGRLSVSKRSVLFCLSGKTWKHLGLIRRDTPEKAEARIYPPGCFRPRLVANQVLEIRRLAAEGVSYTVIADRFDVTWGCIDLIAKRKRWKYLAEQPDDIAVHGTSAFAEDLDAADVEAVDLLLPGR